MEHAGSMVGIFKCTLELVVLFIFNFFNDISLMCTYKERVIFLCAFGFVALNPLRCHIQRSCNLCVFFFGGRSCTFVLIALVTFDFERERAMILEYYTKKETFRQCWNIMLQKLWSLILWMFVGTIIIVWLTNFWLIIFLLFF